MVKWKVRARRLLREWRANFIVWAVQWIGGSVMLTSLWHLALQEYWRRPVDWIFFGMVFGIGLLLVLFSFWKESGKEDQYSKTELDEKLEYQRTEIESKIPSILINGKPALGTSKRKDDSKVDLLCPVQKEALSIARDLRDFYASLGPYPGDPVQQDGESTPDYLVRFHSARTEKTAAWRKKLAHGYANRGFGSRITSLMNRAGEDWDYPAYVPTYAENISPDKDALPRLAQQMEMVAIWINRRQRNEVNLLGETRAQQGQ